MAKANPMNNGVITGKLIDAPVVHPTQNGNASVQFRLSVRRNFKTDGKYGMDFILFSCFFVKADQSKLLAKLKKTPKGTYLTVAFHVQSYTKNNSVQLSLVADTISFIDIKNENSTENSSFSNENPFSDMPF